MRTSFLGEVLDKWRADRALSHGAALAYYALFSLAPLLVLVIAVAGLALGRAAAQGELVARISSLVGPDAARTVEGMIASVSAPRAGLVATAISIATMLLGASGMFGQLQSTLNDMWNAPESHAGIRGVLRQRLASFGVILGIGLLLLASLALTAALAVVHDLLRTRLPVFGTLLEPLNFLISLLVAATLFALLFKLLPDVRMAWRDVWLGGIVTALLFTIGKSLIGLYLGRAGATSVYGAAGSLVLVLLWIYYSAQILLLGAEITEVYSRRYGSRRKEGNSA
jgi:membrane protein